MATFEQRYLVDEDGKRIGVVLEMAEYERLLEELEELDAIRAYDAAKGRHEEAIPFEEAAHEIERRRS